MLQFQSGLLAYEDTNFYVTLVTEVPILVLWNRIAPLACILTLTTPLLGRLRLRELRVHCFRAKEEVEPHRP